MTKAKKKEALSLEEKLEKALVPVDEQPYEVPANWCWVKLESIKAGEDAFFDGDWILGENMNPEGEVRLLQLSDIGVGDFLDKSDKHISQETFEQLGCTSLKAGDVMISRMAEPIARSCIVPEFDYAVITAVDVAVLRCNSNYINNKYVNYLCNAKWFTDKAMSMARGTTRTRITRANLGMMPFPLPPLAEQQRIVEQIEKLFAMLDEAKEKTQDALESFDKRKAAILNKAIRGELTIEWRKNNQIDLASWDNVKFKDFCLLKRGFDLPTNERVPGDFPLVTSSGVNDYICEYKVRGPGVITGRSGTIGKVFLVEDDYWPLNTTLYSENLYENEPEYVYYFLQTFDFKKYSSSTAVPTLNRNLFSDVIVSVPTKEEQIQIVKVIKRLLDPEEHIKELIVNTINDIDIMKKTVLAKAFRGEFGTNNPNEENAVELLKSILM